MANQEQLNILKQGVEVWNPWRLQNNELKIDLRGADLSRENLRGFNLSRANLNGASLNGTDFRGANLMGVSLFEANLDSANFSRANLFQATIFRSSCEYSRLIGTNFCEAFMMDVKFSRSDFTNAYLYKARLDHCDLRRTTFKEADLSLADLRASNIIFSDFSQADLRGADLHQTNLSGVNLSYADLRNTELSYTSCVETIFENANIENARIYGISVWNNNTEGLKQKDLIFSKHDEPILTVDDIEVAQFIFLMLNNDKIRNVISTIANKGVLILGRFTPERKKILDAMREKLRELNYLPIMFDFEKVSSKDFSETIKVLAGMSRFVIADISNPSSSPLELQATLPDYKIPFVPIIESGQKPFAMFRDLTIYPWCLDVRKYKSEESLMKAFQKSIVDRALAKEKEILSNKNKNEIDIKDIEED